MTEKEKPTRKTFPDGSNRQGSVTDGLPSGNVDFSHQFFPDGLSQTVTVTFRDGPVRQEKNWLGVVGNELDNTQHHLA